MHQHKLHIKIVRDHASSEPCCHLPCDWTKSNQQYLTRHADSNRKGDLDLASGEKKPPERIVLADLALINPPPPPHQPHRHQNIYHRAQSFYSPITCTHWLLCHLTHQVSCPPIASFPLNAVWCLCLNLIRFQDSIDRNHSMRHLATNWFHIVFDIRPASPDFLIFHQLFVSPVSFHWSLKQRCVLHPFGPYRLQPCCLVRLSSTGHSVLYFPDAYFLCTIHLVYIPLVVPTRFLPYHLASLLSTPAIELHVPYALYTTEYHATSSIPDEQCTSFI